MNLVFIKPRSILQLTITGFVVVSGLLVVALLITARQMDLLSTRGQQVVEQTIAAMTASRILLEQTSALERNARQYRIVGEASFLNVYKERRASFQQAASTLDELQLNERLVELLEQVRAQETATFNSISSDAAENLDQRFGQLMTSATNVSANVTSWANQQISNIRDETANSQRLLTLQTVFLIGAAIGLAGVFTTLITRPLKNVGTAISNLGSGKYEKKIDVSGPTDLVAIGQQLEWLRERLAGLEQQRTLFLRHVSHELKSPLATIQESTSLLGDGVVGELSDSQRELIDIQAKSLKKLHSLIDDLLRQHERNYAIVNIRSSEIRLDKLINKILADHSYTIRAAKIVLRLNLEKCSVSGNKEQLRVVFDNVIANGVRFSPEGGELSINLFYENDNVVALIQDAGPGIEDHERDKIFEAFYSGKQPRSENYKGSGLGLAIAREYVVAHDGSIEIVPRSGHGACFRIALPNDRNT